MVEKESKEKKPKEKYELREVATQTGLAIVDTETNKAYSTEEAILKILNDLQKLKALLN